MYKAPDARGTLSFPGGGVGRAGIPHSFFGEGEGVPPSHVKDRGGPPPPGTSERTGSSDGDSMRSEGYAGVNVGGWYPVFRTTGGEGDPPTFFGEGVGYPPLTFWTGYHPPPDFW